MKAPCDLQIFAHGQFRIRRWSLNKVPHLRPGPASIRTDCLSEHFDISRAWADHTQQRANGRRLARAVETEKAINFSRTDSQINAIDGANIAENFGEIISLDCKGGHVSSLPRLSETSEAFFTFSFLKCSR